MVNGPRFSTKAESRIFSKQGIHTISMTQYPEAVLAREREICYLGIGIVTDYDAGLEGRSDIEPVSMSEINRMFAANVDKVRKLITEIVSSMPQERSECNCSKAMANAMSETSLSSQPNSSFFLSFELLYTPVFFPSLIITIFGFNPFSSSHFLRPSISIRWS